jgi:arylsulfatase A-like enzyme
MKIKLPIIAVVALLQAGALGEFAAADAPSKPNIIFILTDDIGYGDLSCYGQKKIKTPNLDKLAADGVRFTQAYSGSTVCAPSRSCLMTGQHTGHTTVRGNLHDFPLRANDVTVAEVLKQAGYATALFGKWGLGDNGTSGAPRRKGFDEFVGYLGHKHAHEPFPAQLFTNQGKMPLPGNRGDKLGTYAGDVFTEQACKFIRARKDQSFFVFLSYTAGHFDYILPNPGPYGGTSWPRKEKFYAAMITRMDRDVGRLRELLKELNLDKRTIILFTSDNGPTTEAGHNAKFFRSSGGLRGKKRDLYEGGIRVPAIACWPGQIKPGTVSPQVWAFWDFLPTAAELAGATAPENTDGISMVPALLGQPQRQHDYLYWEFHEGPRSKQAIRLGDWKAVRFGGPGKPIELYDLKTDASEKRNVAGQHRDVIAKAEKILNTARTDHPNWPIKRGGR